MMSETFMRIAPRIGPTEDNLLTMLGRYVRATVEQCTRHSYSPNSLRFVRSRLTALVEAEYVAVSLGFSQNGKPPFVYSPTLKGWHYVQDSHGMPIPSRWRPSEAHITDFRDYLHDLTITDFGIATELFCREATPYVRFVRFVHDRLLPQTRVQLPTGAYLGMRLDGFGELRIKRSETERTKQRCHLLEIDRNTHFEKALRQKVMGQLAYVQGGYYEKDFNTKSLTYLWVCPGLPERVKYLLKLFETVLTELKATEFAPLFYLTAENPATAEPVSLFVKPCWYLPFQEAPTALLAPLPASRTVRLNQSRYLPQEQYDRFLMASGDALPLIAAESDAE